MSSPGIHIALSAEPVFDIGGLVVTNATFTSVLVSLGIIILAIYTRIKLQSDTSPSGIQNIMEWIIESLYNMVHNVTQNTKKSKHFFPFIATFFLFIIVNNYSGLIPGVGSIGLLEKTNIHHQEQSQINQAHAQETEDQNHTIVETDSDQESHHPTFIPLFRAATSDLNTTLALAIISVAMTQFFGLQFLNLSYLKKFFYNPFVDPIKTFVGILELISEFAKIVSFAFRLFGNIFAGEVLLVVMAFIGGKWFFFAPIPLYGFELFVGLIQALVFSMLSLVFFNMATISHDDH